MRTCFRSCLMRCSGARGEASAGTYVLFFAVFRSDRNCFFGTSRRGAWRPGEGVSWGGVNHANVLSLVFGGFRDVQTVLKSTTSY